MRSLHQKKFRNETGLFIVEGKKMVEEALNSSYELHSLYTADASFSSIHTQAIHINSREMAQISMHSTAPDHLAVMRHRVVENRVVSGNVVVLDGIADPGNLGTIVRTADWFGISRIFCTQDCVELYNPKVVQATMGSIFRVDVLYAEVTEIVSLLGRYKYRMLGADLGGESIYSFPFGKLDAIVIGSESHGIRSEMRSAISSLITIPKQGKAESLNASIAASIILSEVYRRQ